MTYAVGLTQDTFAVNVAQVTEDKPAFVAQHGSTRLQEVPQEA